MRRRFHSVLLAVAMAFSSSVAMANDCDASISNALEQSRSDYVNGIAGLASNNYSSRPGSYSSMACLDQFMQGEMDIFFRPPDLDSLLQQVLSFACDQIMDALQGGGGGSQGTGQMLALMKEFSGGLNVPSSGGGTTKVNMANYLSTQTTMGTNSLNSLFGGNR